MRKRLMVTACLSLLSWAGTTFAAPAANGLTGQLVIPTADVSAHNTLSVNMSLIEGHSRGGVNFGIYPGVELGVGIQPGSESDTNVSLFGKIALAEETAIQPALALGVHDDAIFGVVSKALTHDLRLSVGYGSGWMDGAFGGVSMTLNPVTIQGQGGIPLPSTALMLEVMDHRVDLGARLTFNPGFRVDLGLQSDAGPDGLSHLGYMLGASFSTAL